MFDADELRSDSYRPGSDPMVMTSRLYPVRNFGVRGTQAYVDVIRRLTWQDAIGMYCLKKNFEPMSIPVWSPQLWETIASAIRQDRSSCSGFCQYQPGFTAVQHTTLQLEEHKARRQEVYEQQMAQLNEGLIRATWVLAAATIAVAVATCALVAVTIGYFR
jgi:hypothetical protein